MREKVLSFVACPECGTDLRIDSAQYCNGDKEEIYSGNLVCLEDHRFPVINGVPRLLPRKLLLETLRLFHSDRMADEFDTGAETNSDFDVKRRTLQSFSYQWNVFSEMYSHWEDNFRSYFEPLLPPDKFHGKIVLDAGCGFGRHAYYSGKFGAEVVAMDLSEAVEAAHVNTRSLANVHVIQGDIYNPPLKSKFDLIYSVGVIQHLPKPAEGFKELSRWLVQYGQIFVWVYGRRSGLYRVIDAMRKVTTHMSMKSVYRLSFFLNIASFLCFNFPYKLLMVVPGARGLASSLPFTRYADLPLRVGHADWFDRLAVPSTVYFTREEVKSWYDGGNLNDVQIQSRDGIGWRALGRAPASRLINSSDLEVG